LDRIYRILRIFKIDCTESTSLNLSLNLPPLKKGGRGGFIYPITNPPKSPFAKGGLKGKFLIVTALHKPSTGHEFINVRFLLLFTYLMEEYRNLVFAEYFNQ